MAFHTRATALLSCVVQDHAVLHAGRVAVVQLQLQQQQQQQPYLAVLQALLFLSQHWTLCCFPAVSMAACRIDTILDCDHLLVLSNGHLVEQGAPKELAALTGGAAQGGPGVFAGMVEAAKAAAAGHHH